MAPDLARSSRRENPILEPVFDELRTVVDYTEVSLYKVDGDCCTLVTYRGPVPQAEALSLSFPVSTLTIAGSALGGDSPAEVEAIASSRKPFEELLGIPPGAHPKSQLTVPFPQGAPAAFLFILGHVEPRFYTLQHADRVLRFALDRARAIENGARFAELAQRAVEAEVLLSVQRAIASRLELSAVLWLIAEEACRLTFARSALILALEADELVLEAFSGERPSFPPGSERWPADREAIGRLEGPVSSRRRDAAGWLGGPAAAWLGGRDFVAVPLGQGSRTTGLLVVVEKRLGVYDAQDERRLAMLASAASVCLDNARLYRQARHVAALEERDRLARELHDELAQALSYLKMQASLAEQEVQAGEREAAQAHLAELKEVVDGAYSSVREAIFGLRHPVGVSSGFFASLDRFLAEYRTHYGLNVTLEMALDPPPGLAPEVELQLARIVQESLTNVRRHAAARHVRVLVDRRAGSIVVRIVDDGKGFDVDAVLGAEGQHYGVQIIRERAESFGGSVVFVSAPGCGSEVIVTIPAQQD